MKAHRFHLIFLLLAILLFVSCKHRSFTKINPEALKNRRSVVSSCVRIKSYTLTYNPASNGYILLEPELGSPYEKQSVDGGSFSSIYSLLKEPDVLFDTIRKEVVIKKSFQK